MATSPKQSSASGATLPGVYVEESSHVPSVVQREDLHVLFEALRRRGYTIIGPKHSGSAITYETILSDSELPEGLTEEQSPGGYRLRPRSDKALFGYTAGPHAWKRFLHPAQLTVWRAKRNGKAFEFLPGERNSQPTAFIGVRPCDLRAIGILDKVLAGGEHADGGYRARRNGVFIVAVNCTESGGTCFCSSMGTGPRAREGYDLALTELIDGGHHWFLVHSGSRRGEEILSEIPHRPAGPEDLTKEEQAISDAGQRMGRSISIDGLPGLLRRNADHPRWTEAGRRCLSCSNCTMVCPTCFCTTVEDVRDLTGAAAERRRTWDSCFTLDFSYLHGGSVRASVAARYRQWASHKFSYWVDQFGSPGCVGCGRCITWCPVGIDITEELRAIQGDDRSAPSTTSTKEKKHGNP